MLWFETMRHNYVVVVTSNVSKPMLATSWPQNEAHFTSFHLKTELYRGFLKYFLMPFLEIVMTYNKPG